MESLSETFTQGEMINIAADLRWLARSYDALGDESSERFERLADLLMREAEAF